MEANDGSSSGVGGRWRMLGGEHKDVQMVRELVRIRPHQSGFVTTADFVFRNHGAATTVVMGFPEESGGVDSSSRLSFSSFASWVDGRRVKVRRRVNSQSSEDYQWLWTKTVHFGRHQTRRVRVRYVSEGGGGDSSGYSWVSYDFTGGNWRGQVEKSVLDVILPRGSYSFPDYAKDQWKPLKWRRATHFVFEWKHWQAQKQFQLTYKRVSPIEPATRFDFSMHSVELSAARLGLRPS